MYAPWQNNTNYLFPSSNNKAVAHFELIHCDVWGSFSIPTQNSAKFFLTIVDDFSRCTWTFVMSSKSQTRSLIPFLFALVERQFNSKIKQVRSVGTEFFLTDFF